MEENKQQNLLIQQKPQALSLIHQYYPELNQTSKILLFNICELYLITYSTDQTLCVYDIQNGYNLISKLETGKYFISRMYSFVYKKKYIVICGGMNLSNNGYESYEFQCFELIKNATGVRLERYFLAVIEDEILLLGNNEERKIMTVGQRNGKISFFQYWIKIQTQKQNKKQQQAFQVQEIVVRKIFTLFNDTELLYQCISFDNYCIFDQYLKQREGQIKKCFISIFYLSETNIPPKQLRKIPLNFQIVSIIQRFKYVKDLIAVSYQNGEQQIEIFNFINGKKIFTIENSQSSFFKLIQQPQNVIISTKSNKLFEYLKQSFIVFKNSHDNKYYIIQLYTNKLIAVFADSNNFEANPQQNMIQQRISIEILEQNGIQFQIFIIYKKLLDMQSSVQQFPLLVAIFNI